MKDLSTSPITLIESAHTIKMDYTYKRGSTSESTQVELQARRVGEWLEPVNFLKTTQKNMFGYLCWIALAGGSRHEQSSALSLRGFFFNACPSRLFQRITCFLLQYDLKL